jgi:sec-independent protein translocase protein TatA
MELLRGIGPIGIPELLIIAFVVVLIFGVGRLPEVGGALGKGIREFRKATKDEEEGGDTDMRSDSGEGSEGGPEALASEAVFCGECGTKNPRSNKFCSQCGTTIGAPVA